MQPIPISRRFALLAAASTLAVAASPALGAGKDDFVIVPGRKFGAIGRGATLTQIEKAYGKANVRVRTLQPPHADLPKQRAAVIFAGTPNEAVALLAERGNRVEGIYVEKAGGKWATKEGLRVGLSVEEMERLYGGPFAITGFGQDGGGAVNREPAKAPARDLYIRFTPGRSGEAPEADNAVLNGEKGFRSDHPAARRAKLKVSVIWWQLA